MIALSVPLGVGAAVYLEEYAPDTAFTRLVELNLNNLAGVPSVVYGILGLSVFVRGIGLGPVILAGSLTLSLLVVPMTSARLLGRPTSTAWFRVKPSSTCSRSPCRVNS